MFALYVNLLTIKTKNMKTKNLLITTLLLAGLTFTFSGCKKEKGCTNTSAENFESSAEEDDGSCIYTGSYVLWIETGDLPTGYSANVYLNDIYQGNIAVTFASAPNCDATGALTINKNLGSDKSGEYTIKVILVVGGVEDTDPANYLYDNANFEANTCTSLQL